MKKFFIALAIINFATAIYSMATYYSYALERGPTSILIMDCPIAAILFGTALILIIYKKAPQWFLFLVFVANIKYGLWTLFVIGVLSTETLFAQPNQWIIIASHLLLMVEAFLLLRYIEPKKFSLGITLAWFIFNDALDYVLFLHPWFPKQYFEIVAVFSVTTTIIVCAIAFILSKAFK